MTRPICRTCQRPVDQCFAHANGVACRTTAARPEVVECCYCGTKLYGKRAASGVCGDHAKLSDTENDAEKSDPLHVGDVKATCPACGYEGAMLASAEAEQKASAMYWRAIEAERELAKAKTRIAALDAGTTPTRSKANDDGGEAAVALLNAALRDDDAAGVDRTNRSAAAAAANRHADDGGEAAVALLDQATEET